jgi:hypothetical protein
MTKYEMNEEAGSFGAGILQVGDQVGDCLVTDVSFVTSHHMVRRIVTLDDGTKFSFSTMDAFPYFTLVSE